MKKVLFSTTHFNTIENGPAFFANLLYKSISKNHDLRILTEDVNKENDCSEDKVYAVDLKKNSWNRFFYQFFRIFTYHQKALDLFVNQFSFDVLVYNNAFTGVWSTIQRKTPVIVMINDYNRIDFLQDRFSLKKKYFKNLMLFQFEKIAAKNSSRVIVNSKFLKDTVCSMYKLESEMVKVLYKGIDLKSYNYRLREKLNKEIQILFVKGGYENGGLWDLVEAIKLIDDYQIKLIIIGPRFIDLNDIHEKLSAKGMVNYELMGPTHPDKIHKYRNQADIFCVPSHKEALGVANMEALASGIPVVSTNVGGIPEVLDYGNCGWLVEPNYPQQLAVAIQECIEKPELRIQKSERGVQFVQQFDSKYLMTNFFDIIEETLK